MRNLMHNTGMGITSPPYKIPRETASEGRQVHGGCKIFANIALYLGNGTRYAHSYTIIILYYRNRTRSILN